jgi:hypothetical protein
MSNEYNWITEQIPEIVKSVMRGVKKAQEAGEPVEMPDYLVFQVETGKFKVDFDVAVEKKFGDNGNSLEAVNFAVSQLYHVKENA